MKSRKLLFLWCYCIGPASSLGGLRTYNLQGPQVVHTLTYDSSVYKTTIGYSTTGKHTVREFVERDGAVAGINGGYHDFNPDTEYKGGITRLRVDNRDIVIKNSVMENGLQNEDVNGVLGIGTRGKVYIFKSLDLEKKNWWCRWWAG